MDAPPPRRKRSAAAALSAVGAASMLAACDGPVDEAKLSEAQFGPATEVSAFASVAECVASGSFDERQCQLAQGEAWDQNSETAPQYATQQECEDNFGEDACAPRTGGGGSYFAPLLTGFLIGQALDGGRYRYGPLYRDRRGGRYYTGSGAWLTGSPGGGRYRYQVGARGLERPISTARVQTRSAVVSRGGFGGRASAGSGGWGGGG